METILEIVINKLVESGFYGTVGGVVVTIIALLVAFVLKKRKGTATRQSR